jgi:hypothetical protein
MDKAGRYLASLSATRWASAWEQHLLAQVAVPELAGLQDLLSSLRIRDDVADVGSWICAEVFKRATVRYRNNIPASECSAPGFGQVCLKLPRRLPHHVGRPIALDAPAVREGADVHRVETEFVIEPGYQFPGLGKIRRRRQGAPVTGPGRPSVVICRA